MQVTEIVHVSVDLLVCLNSGTGAPSVQGSPLGLALPLHYPRQNLYRHVTFADMAGPRANLAVTKDGETYNKLQRPDVYLDGSALSGKANERKRELANVDKPTPEITPGNKRAKIHHMDSTASNPLRSGDSHPYRSSAPIADCGMRFSLPIDEDEAQYSDDSQGEALAYLRSVR